MTKFFRSLFTFARQDLKKRNIVHSKNITLQHQVAFKALNHTTKEKITKTATVSFHGKGMARKSKFELLFCYRPFQDSNL